MFIYNVKVNSKTIVKVSLIIIAIIITVLFIISVYDIFSDNFKVKDTMEKVKIAYIEPENYTNILKMVYDNPDKYVGQTICFTGYVYRNSDFTDDEFVLARNMIVKENESLIVGFLCDSKEAKNFENDVWVEVIGKISKGNYHGDIPILNVSSIKVVDKPENEYVFPPDDTYIPTAIIY